MKAMRYAGLAGLAALGAQAQAIHYGMPATPTLESMVSRPRARCSRRRRCATPSSSRAPSWRTRAPSRWARCWSGAPAWSCARPADPGQPESIFIRGAGSAGTLVLIDGLRAGSSSAGTTAIEALPIDMIERIEVVKGPMSSLYGSEAVGGVIQIFTRNKKVPNFFANAGYGTDRDRAGSAGIATVEGNTTFSIAGGRAQGGRAQRHQLAQHVQLRPRPRPARERVRHHARHAPRVDRRDAGARRVHRRARAPTSTRASRRPARPRTAATRPSRASASRRPRTSRAGGRARSRWARAATRRRSPGSSRPASRRARTRPRG